MCGHREKLAICLQAKERGCRRNYPANTLVLDFWPPERLSEPPKLFHFVGAALTNSYRGYLKKKFTAVIFDYVLFVSMNSKCSLPTKPLLSIMPTGWPALGMRPASGHIGIEGIEVLVACACLFLVSVHLFATPWTVAHQPPLSVEFSRQEYWSGLPSPGDLPETGIKPRPPALQADSLPSEPPGKPLWTHMLDTNSWLKEGAANLWNCFPLGLIHCTMRFLQTTMSSKAAQEFNSPEANRK